MILQQLLATLIPQRQLPMIRSLLQQIFDDIIIQLFLILVHLHLQTTEVMKQRVAIFLVDDPIQIRSVFYEEISDEETYLLVLETCWFLNKPK